MNKLSKELISFTYSFFGKFQLLKVIDNLSSIYYQKSLSYIIKNNKKLYLIFYIDDIDPNLKKLYNKDEIYCYYKKIYDYFYLKHYFFPKCIHKLNNIFIFELSVEKINITDINYFITKKCIFKNTLFNSNKIEYNDVYLKIKKDINKVYNNNIILPANNLYINQINVNSFCYDDNNLNFIDLNLVILSTDKPTFNF
jgi:hypothetical protein